VSGIAGVILFEGPAPEPGLVERATVAMAARGPDGSAHWHGTHAALGHCMLRTTPESLEEVQPWPSEDAHLVLVLDGRVDNHADLRRTLLGRGMVLRNRSDAELVLRAYEAWGDDCADHIVGEFAFVIWDASRQEIFGARDGAGTRHFYYHVGTDWFGFASEIKGLLALGRIEPKLNESRLLDYLVVEFDRDDEISTFYQDIVRLPAGHAMRASTRGARIWRYWHPSRIAALHFSSLDDCAEGFGEQLRIAVRCRLRSCGPVGAMLSGGLDSSSIVGLVSKELRGDLAQPLRTFSLIRSDRENCPDWRALRTLLDDGWLESTLITSDLSAAARLASLDRLDAADEPFAMSHGLPYALVYRAAQASGCRVVLDGMAGDALFYGGDHSLHRFVREHRYRHALSTLAAYRRHGLDRGVRTLVSQLMAATVPAAARSWHRRLCDRRIPVRDGAAFLQREVAARYLAARRQGRSAGLHPASETDQAYHGGRFMSGLISFAHEVYGGDALAIGVEPRSPYSDRRLIEFAVAMPAEAKLVSGWYKHTLRRCMAGILPDAIRWREDLDGHPGWRFYEQVIRHLAMDAPGNWNATKISGILEPWIDDAQLHRAWRRYEHERNYATGYSVFAIAVLARWLMLRPTLALHPRRQRP
jgi:asparagine synthase (glutamine-hydrolysing)